MTGDEIRERMLSLKEEKYREFQEKLKPSASPVFGVRMSGLRKLAKELAKNDWREYVCHLEPESFYEERLIAGMSIYYAKTDVYERIVYTDKFLPFIDGWAVCDGVCATIKLKYGEEDAFWEYITEKALSGVEFTARFGLVAVLHSYVEEKYLEGIFEIVEKASYAGYYDAMAAAWLLAECMGKFPERTFDYMKTSRLDDMVYNKAIQKMRESYRISPDMKNELKKMTRA